MQKVLYNSLIKQGYIGEDLINIFSFNNKIKQYYIAVEDLFHLSNSLKNTVILKKMKKEIQLIAAILQLYS